MTTTASIICNREVRFIPRGWQHPCDERGRYLPLLPNGYAAANGLTEAEAWPEMPATTGPVRLQGLEIAAYETTTEGTPISPAFPDTPEGRLALADYCAENATTFGDHRADAETWAAILFGDGAASIEMDGRVTIC
jgi:hypothetical protein